jgi:16S rRNA processing protein RimM
MSQEEYFELGTIIKSHGVKGDVVIYIVAENPQHFKKLKSILVETAGVRKEMTVTSIRFKDNLATVHLEGIDDRNTSDQYLKSKVYLLMAELPELDEKSFFFREITGFTIHDATLGNIGVIDEVYELPQHPVFVVIYKEKEALIPATPDFIKKIDRKNKIIEMELPDGLMEVYS